MRQQAVPAALVLLYAHACFRAKNVLYFMSAILVVLKPLLKFFRCDVRSRLLNIGVVAAAINPRPQEPECRLAGPSNNESTYPMVE